MCSASWNQESLLISPLNHQHLFAVLPAVQVLHLRAKSLLFNVRWDAIQTDEAGVAFYAQVAALLLMILLLYRAFRADWKQGSTFLLSLHVQQHQQHTALSTQALTAQQASKNVCHQSKLTLPAHDNKKLVWWKPCSCWKKLIFLKFLVEKKKKVFTVSWLFCLSFLDVPPIAQTWYFI